MNSVVRHSIRFVLVILLQGLLINNLHWLGAFHPYVYIIALVMLPATFPRWAEMLLASMVGLLMDTICSTAGVHMASCVAVAYVRPLLIARLVQDAQRIGTQVCSATIGDWQFLTLLGTMIVVHHAMVFMLEAWSFEHLGWLIFTILLSAIVCFILCFFYDRTQR